MCPFWHANSKGVDPYFLSLISMLAPLSTPPSPMGYIVRKANVMKRCPKVKQNMRINMALTILDNIVRFKRNLKKLFGSKAEIWLSPQNLHCKISIFSNEKKSRA